MILLQICAFCLVLFVNGTPSQGEVTAEFALGSKLTSLDKKNINK